MPIIVSHTPVGALGRAALLAGQAQASQLQAGRDIQLTSMAMAARNQAAQIAASERMQAAQIAASERAQDRTFALQQANGAAMARQRPTEPSAQAQQQKLRRAVSEAEESGAYEPMQIKQMRIFANMNDEQAVRSLLGRLPELPARQQEMERQTKTLNQITAARTAPLTKQLDTIMATLGKQFAPEAQQMLRENPQFADEETQTLFAQQDQLESQVAEIENKAAAMKQMIQFGVSMPEQLAIERQQQAQFEKQEAIQQQRIIEQTRESGRLSDREELAIDTMRDQEKDQRTAIDREITRLSKDLAPFKDESEKEMVKRIIPIQAQIRQLELQKITSFAREKKQIGEFLGAGKANITQVVTDATGQRWQFTGKYQNGKPVYRTIE